MNEQITFPGMEDIPELVERDCNHCKWYAPYNGVCCGPGRFRAEFRRGEEDACEDWTVYGK